jgi:hypothetical protein
MFLNNLNKTDMKKTYKLFYGLLSILMVLAFSCKKNDLGGTGAPTISRVRTLTKTDTTYNVVKRITLDSSITQNTVTSVGFDSTVTSGGLGNQYAIIGTNLLTTKSLTINGVSVYFNPALLTDHSIIFTIPSLTSTATQVPFGPNQTNKIVVVTKYGTVSFNFPITQPPPIITSFAPQVANPGDTVTITGQVFNDVTAVRFDKIPATIIGKSTATQVQVIVPQGVSSNLIYVTTPGGTAVTTTTFGFKYVVYTESLTPGWGGQGSGGYDGYNSTRVYNDTSHPQSGKYDISCVFSNNYGALQLGYGGATPVNVSTLGLTSIKLSVYAGAGFSAGQKIQVYLNGTYQISVQAILTPGAYTDIVIPLSSLGNPATITEIDVQDAGVAPPCTIYVDNLGFI